MTSKQRMLAAMKGQKPDRLPVTTHHVMTYFLKKYMQDISVQEFFDYFGLDPILWINPIKPDSAKNEYFVEFKTPLGWTMQLICSDQWRVEVEQLSGARGYPAARFTVKTPKGDLSTVLEFNDYTFWVCEHLVKSKKDVELIGEYVTSPTCDVEAVNIEALNYGSRGLVRGNICCFDIFGQPGTWQDAACLYGIEKLIVETWDDPEWVHSFLKILQKRKNDFIASLQGAAYDILELGGGDASSTVISPAIFDQFVAPYDGELIDSAHKVGQRIVYHTCGGMMPILESIAAMKPDAMETFTPPDMGGDVDLAQARKRLPEEICMIGGFDQFHFFQGCTPQQTRAEVRRCFDSAGTNGGFILCPSDHFFDADISLIKAFADEAHKCLC